MGQIFDQNLKLSKEACDHARENILHGCSQIENNNLPKQYYDALNIAVLDDLRKLINERKTDPLALVDKDVYKFEKNISLTSKYSLGNCHEMALQVLDFVLQSGIDVNAEVIAIDGEKGDHAFVVIGRKSDSIINDPNSWGPDAIICDAWAEHDQVYPASEYTGKLKSFYREYTINSSRNCLLDYNPDLHTLRVLISSQDLKNKQSASDLISGYQMKLQKICDLLRQYHAEIDQRANYLLVKHGQHDEKYLVFENKALEASNLLNQVNTLIEDVDLLKDIKTYRKLYNTTRKNLNQSINGVVNLINLNEIQMDTLNKYRKNTLSCKARRFFNIPTDSKQQIDNVKQSISKELFKKAK